MSKPKIICDIIAGILVLPLIYIVIVLMIGYGA
jgi:hypothetical protein